jgi:mannosyl-3-phosphoglycerate phosphatase
MNPAPQDVVITDLDGTLLDHATYSFDGARPALELLDRRRIPVIYCSSKTRREIEHWRQVTGNRHPFIVENGGAVIIPRGYFHAAVPRAEECGEFAAVRLGDPYPALVEALAAASRESGCRVRGFHDMSVDEVARECDLPASAAELAKAREYDEPFLVADPEKAPELLAAIVRLGKRCTRGGRFFHITGDNDKAAAVRILLDAYRADGHAVRSVGIGDGLNDAAFLNAADEAILIRTPWIEELQAAVPGGRPTSLPGPRGWNEAVLRLFG